MKFLIRLFYLPMFLIVGNGIAIYIVQSGLSKGWLFVLVSAFIALAFVLERAVPYDAAFNESQGDRVRDFFHALVNETFNVLGVLSVPLVASFISLPSIWPHTLPLWQQLLIAILIADVGITLAHFASHRIHTLWRLHAVHHSVKRMYGFNGLMKHPLHQFIETLAGVTPLLLMGVSQDVLSLLIVAVVLQLLLQHSNVAYFTGPLKYLLAINVVHRFHHLKTAEEGDVNFGLFTNLTDFCLSTAYYDRRRIIRTDDLGIGDQPDYPSGYLSQLIQPFR
ncbi:MAG TPA: fatty acid hydroxylase [Parvularcula sp.]|nr:fatty acid hydroxylase [Parvularcula sp.]